MEENAELDRAPACQTTFCKRQSKTMQKYLKRVFEDKSRELYLKLKESSNFSKPNLAPQHPIDKFYRHDFNSSKRSLCESSLKEFSRYSQPQ